MGEIQEKSPISFVQEYCAKRSYSLPTYDIQASNDKTNPFICYIHAIEIKESGIGLSKKAAKTEAAKNLINILKRKFSDIEKQPNPEITSPIGQEMVYSNFRVKEDLDDAMHKSSDTHIVATIKGEGVKSQYIICNQTAKIKALNSQKVKQIFGDNKLENFEEDLYLKLKIYYDLTRSNKSLAAPKNPLSNRHNYFSKFPENLKIEAKKIINLKSVYGSKECAMKLFQSINIKPKISMIHTKNSIHRLIDLNCEIDAVFTGHESKIYDEILEYFTHMLV